MPVIICPLEGIESQMELDNLYSFFSSELKIDFAILHAVIILQKIKIN